MILLSNRKYLAECQSMHADGILYLSTHFCAVLELVVVADLTEATRQRPTFDTDAILSVNDYGAGVSHLEVLRYDTIRYEMLF